MRGDIPLAAFRLLTSLRVTTHYKPERAKKEYVKTPYAASVKGQKLACDGVEYPSHTVAMRELRVGHARLMAMIAAGKVRYVK